MFDFHCHILPQIDDGASSLEESLQMARELAEMGFSRVLATPHYIENHYMPPAEMISASVSRLNDACRLEGINFQVFPGGEVMLSPHLLQLLSPGKPPLINGSSYLLLEIPLLQSLPLYTEDLLFRIRTAGYRPVLAHPERCLCFLDEPEKLSHLRRYDLLYQVNLASFAGHFGERSRRLAFTMLRSNMISFLGSDAHRPGEGRDRLSLIPGVLSVLESELGKENLRRLSEDNPQRVLLNEVVEPPALLEYKRLPFLRKISISNLFSCKKRRKKKSL